MDVTDEADAAETGVSDGRAVGAAPDEEGRDVSTEGPADGAPGAGTDVTADDGVAVAEAGTVEDTGAKGADGVPAVGLLSVDELSADGLSDDRLSAGSLAVCAVESRAETADPTARASGVWGACPQAARPSIRQSDRNRDKMFFMFILSSFCMVGGKRDARNSRPFFSQNVPSLSISRQNRDFSSPFRADFFKISVLHRRKRNILAKLPT